MLPTPIKVVLTCAASSAIGLVFLAAVGVELVRQSIKGS